MAVRDAMRASAAQFLDPGETIQAVISAQTGSPLVRAIAGAFGLPGAFSTAAFSEYRIVAVTDQRILVLDAGRRSIRNARAAVDMLPRGVTLGPAAGVVDILPREVRLGPATGVWHSIQVPSGRLWVHRRFYQDMEAADMMVTQSSRQAS